MQNRRVKIFFLLIPVFLMTATGWSQLTISFNAPIYGQSVDGLSFVQIFNSSSEDVTATVTINVKESTAGTVLTASISSVPLRRGNNTLDRSAFSRGRFVFGPNYYGQTVSQTGRFPEGEYEYCFEVEITDSKTVWPVPYFENCFVQNLQPLTPLLLIDPVDGDESCNTRPPFTWQLPLPIPEGAKCRLILAEKKDKQDIAEAINYNPPLINQGNIIGSQLIYPSGAPSLQEEKSYVWQVVVYVGKAILKKSEIWTYRVKCEKEIPQQSGDGYRELKESEDGNYYIATNVLRFSFRNPYGEGAVNYSIISVSEPGTVIKNLPSLRMGTGLNKYELELSGNNLFIDGKEYLLKVKLINNQEMKLRFLYRRESKSE